MNSMNPWVMGRLVALRCEELKRVADQARANPRRYRDRWQVAPARATAYAVPKILGADVLERLAALVAFDA
jgi:hypothetical protein